MEARGRRHREDHGFLFAARCRLQAFERYFAIGAATPTDDFYAMIVGKVDELLAADAPADI
jgi:hypothetical protein